MRGVSARSVTPSSDDALIQLRDGYVRLQLQGNRRQALRYVDDLVRDGVAVRDVQRHVIGAAQREIGRLWECNRISVAQEHMATAISQVALAHLYQHAEAAPSLGQKIIVACVPGELHDFPARLVADALDLAGYEARFLGADVPTESLLAAIDKERPDLLALSITMKFHERALRDQVAKVRSHTQGKLPIAVGGAGFALAADLGADVTVATADELLKALEELRNV